MVCGIDLKGNEARIVLLQGTKDSYNIISQAPKKIKLVDSSKQESVRQFVKEIEEFFHRFGVKIIGVKERGTKGKFAGGSVSFKMEGLIQATQEEVLLVHSRTIKAKLKDVDIDLSTVNKYQEEALKIAWILLG